jgi:hypothetical protein
VLIFLLSDTKTGHPWALRFFCIPTNPPDTLFVNTSFGCYLLTLLEIKCALFIFWHTLLEETVYASTHYTVLHKNDHYYCQYHCLHTMYICLLQDISGVPTWYEAIRINFVLIKMYIGMIFARKNSKL